MLNFSGKNISFFYGLNIACYYFCIRVVSKKLYDFQLIYISLVDMLSRKLKSICLAFIISRIEANKAPD